MISSPADQSTVHVELGQCSLNLRILEAKHSGTKNNKSNSIWINNSSKQQRQQQRKERREKREERSLRTQWFGPKSKNAAAAGSAAASSSSISSKDKRAEQEQKKGQIASLVPCIFAGSHMGGTVDTRARPAEICLWNLCMLKF